MRRAEARRALDAIIAPIVKAEGGPKTSVTLERFVKDEYLVEKSRRWKASTRGTTEQRIDTHILNAFGKRALASIRRRDLQAHIDALAEGGLSESVVQGVRWQLVAIFKMASSDGVIAVNPADGLMRPRMKAKPTNHVIDADAVRRAYMALPIRERLIIRLAAHHGFALERSLHCKMEMFRKTL